MGDIPEKEDLNIIAESLLESEEYYIESSTPLLSPKMRRDQDKLEILDYLRSGELSNQISRAFQFIIEEAPHVLSEEELDELNAGLDQLTDDKFEESPDKSDSVDDITYQKILGLSDESLKNIYKIGYLFFQDKQIDEALDVFTLLFTLNPKVNDFAYSLGLCYQQKEAWTDALAFLKIAIAGNPDYIAAHVSALECARKSKDDQNVAFHFKELMRLKEDSPEEYQKWESLID